VLDRLFQLGARGTTVRTEVLGGVTTFATMAYIIVVNPAILAAADIPIKPSTVATILVAVFGCLLMGLYANRPIAIAPYMGENAFIAFSLAALGITWQQRLGAVFVSGLFFALITLAGARAWLLGALSPSMKHSFAAGVGLFLALIGLVLTGVVAKAEPPDAPLRLGDLRAPAVLLGIATFVAMITLVQAKVRGALLVAMAMSAVAGTIVGLGQKPAAVVGWPFGDGYDLGLVAGQLDVAGVLRFSFLPILLTLVLMSLLDTLGTLVALGAAGGMLDEKGNFPQVERPMMVDALACVFSGLIGTSTSGAYIESAAGIREGARTGLAAVTTGLLFALSLFFLPVIGPLQQLRFAYAPALIVVGIFMVGSIRHVDFDDLTELVPAFATIVLMVFTYNIANGITAGLVLYPLVKVLAGRARELNRAQIVMGGVCALYFVFGLPH
jgi:AGZA family xanthine/uracil permease-like MFS transporter